MQIFRFEWKRKRKYILIWAATLAVCIFSMTPVYYGMIETVETLPVEFTQGGFFETVGISLELLMEPLGMYSFLTGFFMVAGGIFGMHLGLSLHTEECTGNTAEYLHKALWTETDLYGKAAMCACRNMCNRDFLSGDFISNDDSVPFRISHRGIFLGGRFVYSHLPLFCTIGTDGWNISPQ